MVPFDGVGSRSLAALGLKEEFAFGVNLML
jgi:hypothetical protein